MPKSTDGPTTDYDAYPNGYLLVPLANDYKNLGDAPLNPNSLLVNTVNCLKAQGTTATAQALDKAQQTLAANHSPDAAGRDRLPDGRRSELRPVHGHEP